MNIEVERILGTLVTCFNSCNRPIITGFNHYPVSLQVSDYSILTFRI